MIIAGESFYSKTQVTVNWRVRLSFVEYIVINNVPKNLVRIYRSDWFFDFAQTS